MTIVPYSSEPPRSFEADWLLDPAEIASKIGGTDFVPQALRDNPAAITAALLYGQEIGLGRMQSLARIAMINGRPTLAAEAQRALILAAGHELWFDEATNSRCIACGRRRGSDVVSRVTWTMDDARRAGLAGKNPWRLYPRQMLVARASAELARDVFPDVTHGLMATEELEDDPGLAMTANGPPPEPPAKPTTRRKRRTSVTAGDKPAKPEPPAGPAALDDRAAADEIVREFENAAPTEPETEPLALATPGATDAQKKQIFALMRDAGFDASDRDARLAYTARVIGRTLTSSNELKIGEAHLLIEDLQEILTLPADQRQRRLLGEHELQILLEAEQVADGDSDDIPF